MKHFLIGLLVVAGLSGCVTDEPSTSVDCDAYVLPAEAVNPVVTIQTNLGCMHAEMFLDQVPVTAGNFLALAEGGDYDGSPFHRIISNFMTQGGDYTRGDGRGGKAHADFDPDGDGNIVDEYSPDLRHDQKGTFSMANTGQVNSGGSQFFITFGPTNFLDAYNADGSMKNCGQPRVSCHAVFGQVIEGFETLDAIHEQAASQSGTPVVPVTFESATVAWP